MNAQFSWWPWRYISNLEAEASLQRHRIGMLEDELRRAQAKPDFFHVAKDFDIEGMRRAVLRTIGKELSGFIKGHVLDVIINQNWSTKAPERVAVAMIDPVNDHVFRAHVILPEVYKDVMIYMRHDDTVDKINGVWYNRVNRNSRANNMQSKIAKHKEAVHRVNEAIVALQAYIEAGQVTTFGPTPNQKLLELTKQLFTSRQAHVTYLERFDYNRKKVTT